MTLPSMYRLNPAQSFDKKIDIILAGRKNPVLWNFLKQYEAAHPDVEYLHQIRKDGELYYESNKKGIDSLTSKGFKLFDKLKELRLEIARAEKIPPYIVFNDKTLIDMCAKIPTTKSDMLDVSGVGENKYGKYGERFIAVIKEYVK